MIKEIKKQFNLASCLHVILAESPKLHKQILKISEKITECLQMMRGQILLAGNGGSFSDAQHLTAEFVGRLQYDRNLYQP